MNPRAIILPLALGGLIFWGVLHRDKTASRISGTIEADDARLASRYGGRVEKIFAEEGAMLTNAQPVAELSAPELAARRGAIAAQLAELVKGPRDEEIEAAKKSWEALTVELQNARTDAKRKQDLFAINATSDTERDAAVTKARSLESQAAATKARYDELAAGTRPEQIERLRAQLRELDTQIAELRVTAPAACSLETLHVKLGDVVPPGGPVATIVYPNNLWLRVYVAETSLANVSVGQTVSLRIDGFPNENFTGEIEQINRRAEFTPRNVQTVDERVKQVFGVKIRLKISARLRPGMSADVVFAKAST
jgi:multidrug resistance efflux pump